MEAQRAAVIDIVTQHVLLKQRQRVGRDRFRAERGADLGRKRHQIDAVRQPCHQKILAVGAELVGVVADAVRQIQPVIGGQHAKLVGHEHGRVVQEEGGLAVVDIQGVYGVEAEALIPRVQAVPAGIEADAALQIGQRAARVVLLAGDARFEVFIQGGIRHGIAVVHQEAGRLIGQQLQRHQRQNRRHDQKDDDLQPVLHALFHAFLRALFHAVPPFRRPAPDFLS